MALIQATTQTGPSVLDFIPAAGGGKFDQLQGQGKGEGGGEKVDLQGTAPAGIRHCLKGRG